MENVEGGCRGYLPLQSPPPPAWGAKLLRNGLENVTITEQQVVDLQCSLGGVGKCAKSTEEGSDGGARGGGVSDI